MYVHLLVNLHVYTHRRAMMIIRTLYAGNYRLRPPMVFEVNKWLRLSSFMFLDTYFQFSHGDLANLYQKRVWELALDQSTPLENFSIMYTWMHCLDGIKIRGFTSSPCTQGPQQAYLKWSTHKGTHETNSSPSIIKKLCVRGSTCLIWASLGLTSRQMLLRGKTQVKDRFPPAASLGVVLSPALGSRGWRILPFSQIHLLFGQKQFSEIVVRPGSPSISAIGCWTGRT